MDYRTRITIDPAKRSGKLCIRGLRMTVYDVLEYLASGMSHGEILSDFPDLTEEDIRACLAFADREMRLIHSKPRYLSSDAILALCVDSDEAVELGIVGGC